MPKITSLKKLRILGEVSTYDYKSVIGLKQLFLDGEISLIESEWGDGFRNRMPDLYPLPKKLKSTEKHGIWNTFGNLLTGTIKAVDKKIFIEVKCCNGNNYDGSFESVRWLATFQIKAKHLRPFASKFDYAIRLMAGRLFDKEVKLKESNRIIEIEQEILRS